MGTKSLVRGCAVALFSLLLLGFSRPADAFNYVGAWYVDSPTAVTTLQNAGFNVFVVPAGIGNSNVQAVLQAIAAGNGAILNLNGASDSFASAFVDWLRTVPEYSKVLGYITFSEGNWDYSPQLISLQRQRDWYSALKARDASKTVIVDYKVTACGIPHKELVDAVPGNSWDVVMVDQYSYWWYISDSDAISNLQVGMNDVASYFNTAAGTSVIPLQQAAGVDPAPAPSGPVCGEASMLRMPPNASDEYNVYLNRGLMNSSHALFYYGWGTSPENRNLQQSDVLSAAQAQIAVHKSIFP